MRTISKQKTVTFFASLAVGLSFNAAPLVTQSHAGIFRGEPRIVNCKSLEDSIEAVDILLEAYANDPELVKQLNTYKAKLQDVYMKECTGFFSHPGRSA